MTPGDTGRSVARAIFMRALAEAAIEKAFDRHLQCEKGVLRICDDLYHLASYSRIAVISFGKAGHRMAQARRERVGSGLQGIVADPSPLVQQVPGFRYFCGGHPLPNAE